MCHTKTLPLAVWPWVRQDSFRKIEEQTSTVGEGINAIGAGPSVFAVEKFIPVGEGLGDHNVEFGVSQRKRG